MKKYLVLVSLCMMLALGDIAFGGTGTEVEVPRMVGSYTGTGIEIQPSGVQQKSLTLVIQKQTETSFSGFLVDGPDRHKVTGTIKTGSVFMSIALDPNPNIGSIGIGKFITRRNTAGTLLVKRFILQINKGGNTIEVDLAR